jgi:hypothetical protein
LGLFFEQPKNETQKNADENACADRKVDLDFIALIVDVAGQFANRDASLGKKPDDHPYYN